MKSLIIADIHANLASLEAILEHEGSWDEILFLGDAVIGGPQPDEVLSLLSTLNGFFLMGNHDREALEVDLNVPEKDPHRIWSQWTLKQISDRNFRFMESFLDSCAVERQGSRLRLDHGVLVREWGGGTRLWPDTDPKIFAALGDRYPEPFMLVAHSHVQFRKVRNGTTFVNPGSVGQPRLGQPLACYGVLRNGQIELRAVPYDAEKTCRAMDRMPLDRAFVESWKTCYRIGVLPARYNIRDFAPLREMGFR